MTASGHPVTPRRVVRRFNTTLAQLNAGNVSTRGVMRYFNVSEDAAHRSGLFSPFSCRALGFAVRFAILLPLHLQNRTVLLETWQSLRCLPV